MSEYNKMARLLSIKKWFIKASSTLSIICLLTNAITAFASAPIYFNKGATSATVQGKLINRQVNHYYHFTAKRGQYTTIRLYPRKGYPEFANVGVLTMPSGYKDGGKGGVIYQGCLPETGTYHLRIARNLMATHGQTAGYKATVSILPLAVSKSRC